MMMKEEGDAPLPIESSDGIFLLAIESSFSRYLHCYFAY